MNDLPAPLVHAEVDLKSYPYMPLDVRRLRDSDLAALESPEACWAAVLLWSASWHQVPAASLPDDDKVLANLAGYGRVVKEWMKVRVGALRGWVKCADLRLYHPVVAEKAIEAWESKLRHCYGKLLERLRKENGKRKAAGLAEIGIPTIEQWKSGGYEAGIPQEQTISSAGIPQERIENSAVIPLELQSSSSGKEKISAGIPPENGLNREGEGEGEGEGVKDIKETTLSGKPDGGLLPCREILSYLNERAGKNYRAVPANIDPIRERIKSGVTVEQCRQVVDAKCAEWMSDQKMAKYLRPETLFGRTKFESYLGSIVSKKTSRNEPDYVRAGYGSAAEAAKAAAKAKEAA